MVWRPNVTVAAVVERDGHFLLVEEKTSEGLQLNQPAGHLEPYESITAAVQREVLEETAYDFSPEQITGIYRWTKPGGNLTYLRFAFCGRLGQHHAERTLDAGIVRALWLSRDEVLDSAERHRSPLVVRCIEDYLAGSRYDINALIECSNAILDRER
ncbi:MAG: NUDIX domain-containing protein [Burkholderiales bacterium]|nr:NUDIX domain-containing protein [Burkholderiales bacterium]